MNAPNALRDARARLPIELHLERDDLVVWRHRGSSNRLVLSFSGIGSPDEPVPPIEFARVATGNGTHNALFIIDPRRTWLNGDGLIDRIVEQVRAYAEEIGAEEIVTLGHSMGGFAAIVLSDYLPIASAVALSPQYAVHPDIAGDDTRWMKFRRRIAHHRIGHAGEHMVPGTTYHVFHGGQAAEAPQRDRFPVAENLYHTILPRTVHRVPQKLKKLGLLDKVVTAAMNNRARKVRLLLEPLGGHRRSYQDYPALPPSAKAARA